MKLINSRIAVFKSSQHYLSANDNNSNFSYMLLPSIQSLTSIFQLLTSKTIFSSIILLFLTNIGLSQSLDDYLNYAYEHNPSLKASYTRFEMALQKIPQAKALSDPKITFGYFISPVETRLGPQQARLSLSQEFPWFGTLKAKENAASLEAEAFYQAFLEEKNKITYQVKTAYYPIYEVTQDIKWQEENLQILESYKSLATTTFASGKGTLTDVLRVDIMIEDAKTEIVLLQKQLEALEKTFNRTLNRADSMAVQIDEPLTIQSMMVNYRKDSLEAQNPSLKNFDFSMKAAIAQEEVAKRMAMPKFGLGLDYALVGKRTDADPVNNGRDVLMPMVSVSIPIAKAKYNAAIKEQQLKQQMLQSQKEALTNGLWANYEMAFYDLEKAISLDDLYNKQIEKTKQIVELLQTAYSNSGEDFEEILSAQQQLLKYQIAKTKNIKDYYLALAKLDYLTAKSN